MISKSEDKDYNDLNSDSTSPTSLSTLNSNPMAYTIKQTVVSGHTFSISNRYDFTNCRILGRGSYGVVSQAIDTLTKQRLAIKRIRPYANDEWDGRHTLREIRLMKLLSNHPNVCGIIFVSLNVLSNLMLYLGHNALRVVIVSRKDGALHGHGGKLTNIPLNIFVVC